MKKGFIVSISLFIIGILFVNMAKPVSEFTQVASINLSEKSDTDFILSNNFDCFDGLLIQIDDSYNGKDKNHLQSELLKGLEINIQLYDGGEEIYNHLFTEANITVTTSELILSDIKLSQLAVKNNKMKLTVQSPHQYLFKKDRIVYAWTDSRLYKILLH